MADGADLDDDLHMVPLTSEAFAVTAGKEGLGDLNERVGSALSKGFAVGRRYRGNIFGLGARRGWGLSGGFEALHDLGPAFGREAPPVDVRRL